MQFKIRAATKIPDISVVYRPEEYSFGVESNGDPIPNVIQSILLNTLELHIDDNARVAYVDGLCAHTKWLYSNLHPPYAPRGRLLVSGLRRLPGISFELKSTAGWPVLADRQNGWVCIGNPSSSAGLQAIEFAPCTIAVLKRGVLAAIWLKPLALPPQ